MAKKTIKSLEEEVILWQGKFWKAQDELREAQTRIKQVMLENNTINSDKSWLKQVIQELIRFPRKTI